MKTESVYITSVGMLSLTLILPFENVQGLVLWLIWSSILVFITSIVLEQKKKKKKKER